MITFIEDHRADYGVGPICRVLPIAPATFYDLLAKRADPSLLSDRAVRGAELKPEIKRVFEDNFSVYGVRKVWHQMRRYSSTSPVPQWVLQCTSASFITGREKSPGIRMKGGINELRDRNATGTRPVIGGIKFNDSAEVTDANETCVA